jgi:hypothetical protein
MTVYIEKPAVNLREELASLRNQGGYQEQQFYFDGLVTNGTFDADTNWTKGTGWTIGSGVAQFTSGGTQYANIYQTVSTVVGMSYILNYDLVSISASNCSIKVYSGTGIGGAVIGSDNFVSSPVSGNVSFTATASTTTIGLQANLSAQNIQFDNISVFEVDANDDVIHTMPKGWKPKDVFEDGLLQREGASHDYTVVYDGFDYFVKPAVAPSATTQTCVIGVKA